MNNKISTILKISIAHFRPRDPSFPFLTELQSSFLIGLQFRFPTISLQSINPTVPVGNSVILSPRQKFPAPPETVAPSFAAFEPFALVFALVAVAAAEIALGRADVASSQPFSTR